MNVAFRLPARRSMPRRNVPRAMTGSYRSTVPAPPRHKCWRRQVCRGSFQRDLPEEFGMAMQQSTAAKLDPSLVGERVPLNQIPVIDFAAFLKRSPPEPPAIALKIREPC